MVLEQRKESGLREWAKTERKGRDYANFVCLCIILTWDP